MSKKLCMSNVINEKQLITGKFYGTNSKKIYIACCSVFGWDAVNAKKFGERNRPMFAEIQNNLDIWFLRHSNWTEDVESKKWENRISDSCDEITETWKNPEKFPTEEKSNRLIFSHDKRNGYIFLGVYEITYSNAIVGKRTFKRIATKYPN